MSKFKIKQINNEQDYYSALSRMEYLSDALPNTKDSRELSYLSSLVQLWEEQNLKTENKKPG